MPDHSPTPWITEELYGQRLIVDANGKIVANQRIETAISPEDITHIVRCVNLHDELVGFIKTLVEHEFYDPHALNSFDRVVVADAAKNLLAKAKA